MAVKYQCPKCEKRYVEWGAKKLDFNCPDCEDEKLVLPGLGDGKAAKPSLKRKSRAKKKVAAKKKASPKAKAAKPKKIPAKADVEKANGEVPVLKGENGDGKDAGSKDKASDKG